MKIFNIKTEQIISYNSLENKWTVNGLGTKNWWIRKKISTYSCLDMDSWTEYFEMLNLPKPGMEKVKNRKGSLPCICIPNIQCTQKRQGFFHHLFGQINHLTGHSLTLIQQSGDETKTSQLINLTSNQSSTKTIFPCLYPFDSYFSSTKQVIFKSNQDIQYIKSFYKEWSRGDKKKPKNQKKY